MDHARQPAQDTQQDVDEEVRVAPGLEEDGQGREEDGEDVEKDVALETGLAVARGDSGGRERETGRSLAGLGKRDQAQKTGRNEWGIEVGSQAQGRRLQHAMPMRLDKIPNTHTVEDLTAIAGDFA
jgi:hypothetical protein